MDPPGVLDKEGVDVTRGLDRKFHGRLGDLHLDVVVEEAVAVEIDGIRPRRTLVAVVVVEPPAAGIVEDAVLADPGELEAALELVRPGEPIDKLTITKIVISNATIPPSGGQILFIRSSFNTIHHLEQFKG